VAFLRSLAIAMAKGLHEGLSSTSGLRGRHAGRILEWRRDHGATRQDEATPMKTHFLRTGLVGLAVFAFSVAAQAGSGISNRVSDIVSNQAQIRASVKAERDGWDNIPADKRQELLGKQDQLMRLIDGKQTLDDLAPSDRDTATQTLEWIHTLAAKADDERQVCTRERRTGTHRTMLVCRRAGDMRFQREQAQDAMRKGRQSLMLRKPPPGTEL